MCILFAATYPERTDSLILVSSYAKRIPSEDYPWAPSSENRAKEIAETERNFGDPDALPAYLAPSRMHDEAFRIATARYLRLSSSPRAAAHILEMNTQIDTTRVLPSIHVPTLCIYREHDADVNVEEGRWIAARIEGSKLVVLPGSDHVLNGDDWSEIADEIEEFVTGHRTGTAPDRVLATVLFTDIVGSTRIAAAMGDSAWRELLYRHNAVVRAQVETYRGRVVGYTGRWCPRDIRWSRTSDRRRAIDQQGLGSSWPRGSIWSPHRRGGGRWRQRCRDCRSHRRSYLSPGEIG